MLWERIRLAVYVVAEFIYTPETRKRKWQWKRCAAGMIHVMGLAAGGGGMYNTPEGTLPNVLGEIYINGRQQQCVRCEL